jgi:transcriptional regulator with XRE-family HTH domain
MAGRSENRDTRGDLRGDVRTEIREFLSTRRAKISPAQAGLPTYGGDRRRVSGLRREEVALLAGISSEYYTRLERGNATGVSDSVIDAIAHALQLDDAERTHLLDLLRTAGTTRPPRRRQARQRVRPTVQRVLDSMVGTPGFVLNGRLDILAANQLGLALFSPIYADPGSCRPAARSSGPDGQPTTSGSTPPAPSASTTRSSETWSWPSSPSRWPPIPARASSPTPPNPDRPPRTASACWPAGPRPPTTSNSLRAPTTPSRLRRARRPTDQVNLDQPQRAEQQASNTSATDH